MVSDEIYVDKGNDHEDHLPDTWIYYRVTGVTGLGNLEGTEGATIQVCRVTWPKLEDIPPVNDSPGVVTFENAYQRVSRALKQWNIDRERSIFIGIRDREKE
jgi:hypothetical protein